MAGIAMLVGATASTVFYLGESIQNKPRQPPVSISLAATNNPDSTLVMVADRLGYFRTEGLKVNILNYSTCKGSLNAMFHGRADLAAASETPIMLNILKGEKPMVIAGISSSDRNMGIIARRDRGIRSPRDLIGKRLGVPLGTNADYFLHAWLAVESIPIKNVTIVNIPPENMFDALASNQVDAVSIWHPLLASLENKLGEKGIRFSENSIYTHTFNVVGTKRFLNAHPQIVPAFLRALKNAEKYVRENPAKARNIVAEATQWDIRTLDSVWDDYYFHLGLDPSLMMGMENEARWALANGLAPAQQVPDSLNYIYLKGMQDVSMRDVTIPE